MCCWNTKKKPPTAYFVFFNDQGSFVSVFPQQYLLLISKSLSKKKIKNVQSVKIMLYVTEFLIYAYKFIPSTKEYCFIIFRKVDLEYKKYLLGI